MSASTPNTIVNHGVGGLVTIRLVSPPSHVGDSVEQALGVSSGPSAGADIVVRFVDSLPGRNLRMLELNEAAFDDESFYVIDPFGSRTKLEFDRIGVSTEIVCERSVREIAFLIPIVGLHLLQKGHVLLHSAAFLHRDRAFVATGWKKGGKTELLLAYMAQGATFLADEWTVVSPDGTVRGLPGPMRIWGWHLQYLPDVRQRLSGRTRARLAMLGAYQRLYSTLPRPTARSGVLRERFERLGLTGGVPWAGQVAASAGSLFPGQTSVEPAKLDIGVLTNSAEGETRALETTGTELAQRMVASQEYERMPLRTAYDQFRFGFPEKRNALLERAASEELALLERAFTNVRVLELRHPYPVPLPELYRATEGHLDRLPARP